MKGEGEEITESQTKLTFDKYYMQPPLFIHYSMHVDIGLYYNHHTYIPLKALLNHGILPVNYWSIHTMHPTRLCVYPKQDIQTTDCMTHIQ